MPAIPKVKHGASLPWYGIASKRESFLVLQVCFVLERVSAPGQQPSLRAG